MGAASAVYYAIHLYVNCSAFPIMSRYIKVIRLIKFFTKDLESYRRLL